MTTPKKKTTPHEGELAQMLAVLEANTTLLAFFVGLCFVAALLVLAIWFPNPTAYQYTVFRITLALAAAGIAGVIPGMIRLKMQPGSMLMIYAGGALAVFVMVYLLAPAKLPTELLPPIKEEKPVVPEAPPSPSVSSNTTDAGKEVSALPSTKKEEKPAVLKAIKIGQYLNNRDGTITDTETGLMWKRCSEGLSGPYCEQGKAKKYTWDDAIKRFKKVQYAGYADWRLPTIDELKTLVYCSNGIKDKNDGRCNNDSERPTINQQDFPNTKTLFYWSGSPYAYHYSSSAWYVSFFSGHSDASGCGYNYAVRLVRNAQ
ncbi:DUF1566 domain-containing protein [Desulfobulbus sp. TB]|nr:DUF1566 domain-containing protein [Desulfobulbus sp. TB]